MGLVVLLLVGGRFAQGEGADHQLFSTVLSEFVADGLVDHAGLRKKNDSTITCNNWTRPIPPVSRRKSNGSPCG